MESLSPGDQIQTLLGLAGTKVYNLCHGVTEAPGERQLSPFPEPSTKSVAAKAKTLQSSLPVGVARVGDPVPGFQPELSLVTSSRVTLSSTDCYIVHEIYNGENAQDQFEYELEQALEAQYKYIVIEPTRIGDETARWITVGNCLHKTAVLAGTTCLFTPLALPVDYSHYISLPAGVLSVACCTLYGISWQFDPCCKYQVEYDAYKLSRLPLHTLTSSTPVVLVRKDDLHRKRLHNTIALAALVYCVKKIYELYAV
uniref:Transmembrane protein 11 n=1 Tax=Ficedula albicollis TaxID=59894 RepID=U3KIK1_FICAL